MTKNECQKNELTVISQKHWCDLRYWVCVLSLIDIPVIPDLRYWVCVLSLIDIPVIPDLEEQQDDDIQVKVAIAPK